MEAAIRQNFHAWSELQEQRRQDNLHQTSALISQAVNAAGERWEARIQTALLEAKAHSDEAAQVLASGLRSQGRILAKHTTSLTAIDPAVLMAEVRRLQQELNQSQIEIDGVGQKTARSLRELDTLHQEVASASRHAESGLTALNEQLRSDYNQQLRNVEGRLEFVRREIFYELQATVLKSRGSENAPDRFEPKIRSPEKIRDQLAQGFRLNIGCGHIPLDGYINVDRRDLPGVDIVAEATNIPVDPGSAIEIFASHIVEHFSLRNLEDVILPYWRSLLAPGGRLVIIAPDGAAMLKAVSDRTMSFEAFREVLFGAQEYEGDFHLNLVTTDTTTVSLQRSGFASVAVDYHSRPNGLCYEFRITAEQVKT
ncbi:hypothetical protein J2X36_003082 [Methylobacterium sp. BE186]|uniref:class I SAM-dependent methyltransferase n=1 Tax=Methylobacterium sp. BE186 TaxID=2817715 RepID=UPI0028578571|nr:hypothetical protein [Methylobacterium sp. BE186]MDR7038323.1 hypothetical protein [Methylobacterium sp. BE186]